MNHALDKTSALDSINMSNLDLYKSQSKDYRHALNKIFFTCLKEIPRDILVQGLKKKKIIKSDINLETGKLELMMRDKENTTSKPKTKEVEHE